MQGISQYLFVYPCIMPILIFPSKIWAKMYTLYTAKYGNMFLVKSVNINSNRVPAVGAHQGGRLWAGKREECAGRREGEGWSEEAARVRERNWGSEVGGGPKAEAAYGEKCPHTIGRKAGGWVHLRKTMLYDFVCMDLWRHSLRYLELDTSSKGVQCPWFTSFISLSFCPESEPWDTTGPPGSSLISQP